MSTDLGTTPLPAPTWEPLPPLERRVLGVLVEKQKTSKTADAYPLTLNALTVGCNQKSNRDPVMDLTDDQVEEALSALQTKGLVMRMTGGRAEKFRHLLYEKWTKNGPELAVLAELLLRGPQTKGDLRGRAARMDPIDTLDTLESVLQPLAARRLVVYLSDPDRRGAMLTHGFHGPDELARLRAGQASAPAPTVEAGPYPARTPPSTALTSVESRLADAEAEIAKLKATVAALDRQVAALREQLGLTPAG